ncbi:hypothetical protein SISNIDRAFT_55386 [Sistotremastrum niveocremeum HHB9708]|uniref:Uncharacterized protein n=1 Tax=Sistotremastrum niveocremeum HHB9708 TaxID=1314777 RepID=A0A164VC24_9AGAM|nr:hypothetical protein SISNIDRAFT_55386 [Sistotremastrum niveocremeum HHB9708]
MLSEEIGATGQVSDDLQERLETYLGMLQEVKSRAHRLGTHTKMHYFTKAASIQDEMKDCMAMLDSAYQRFIVRSSISMDKKLTKMLAGVESLRRTADQCNCFHGDEPDEIPRIRVQGVKFGEEIERLDKKTYILRLQHAKITDGVGSWTPVIIRRFETVEEEETGDGSRSAFEKEVELRRDLLYVASLGLQRIILTERGFGFRNQEFASMLGIIIPSRRTRMIVIEEGTIGAYDYLQTLPGLDHLGERFRIVCLPSFFLG